MSEQEPGANDKSKVSQWLDILTGRIGKITVLVAAVGTLVTVAVEHATKIRGLFTPAPGPTPPLVATPPVGSQSTGCIAVRSVKFPEKIVYSDERNDWDRDYRVEVSGRNECGASVGLYMTIKAISNVFDLEPPGLGPAPCEKASNLVFDCWEYKIPVEASADKTWAWSARFPSAKPRNDAIRKKGAIEIHYSIRRTDRPDEVLYSLPIPDIEVSDGR